MLLSDAFSAVMRILALLAGATAALALVVFTFGLAFAALLGMVILGAVRRSRARPYTRLESWLGAVSGVAIIFLVVMSVVFAVGSVDIMGAMRQSAEADRTREPTSFERRLERISPRTPASTAMEKRMEGMAESETFMWVSLILGLLVTSVLLGVLVGSATWGCAMLLVYGATGRWPVTRAVPAAGAR